MDGNESRWAIVGEGIEAERCGPIERITCPQTCIICGDPLRAGSRVHIVREYSVRSDRPMEPRNVAQGIHSQCWEDLLGLSDREGR